MNSHPAEWTEPGSSRPIRARALNSRRVITRLSADYMRAPSSFNPVSA
jgi:hypothetical protein